MGLGVMECHSVSGVASTRDGESERVERIITFTIGSGGVA